jgi:hypothetical protein
MFDKSRRLRRGSVLNRPEGCSRKIFNRSAQQGDTQVLTLCRFQHPAIGRCASVSAPSVAASVLLRRIYTKGAQAEASFGAVSATGGFDIFGFPIRIEVEARAGVSVGLTGGENTGFISGSWRRISSSMG